MLKFKDFFKHGEGINDKKKNRLFSMNICMIFLLKNFSNSKYFYISEGKSVPQNRGKNIVSLMSREFQKIQNVISLSLKCGKKDCGEGGVKW